MRLTWGCGNSHKGGPNKVMTDQVVRSSDKDGLLPPYNRESEDFTGEGNLDSWWDTGMQGSRADLGGNLRARAKFAHFDLPLLK